MSTFVYVLIIVIIIILLHPTVETVLLGIAVLAICAHECGYGREGFENNYDEPFDETKHEEMEFIREPKTYCESGTVESGKNKSKSGKYLGAIDCDEDDDISVPPHLGPRSETYMFRDEDADFDTKGAVQNLNRNDIRRSLTAQMDSKYKIWDRMEIGRELDESERERWEGNNDF